jgi:predicted alpha/beta hydrolase family esterase
MKRAVIVHGWGGTPEEGWLPWLKHQLEQRGFSVEVPSMPETGTPKPEIWVPHLAVVVGTPDEGTILIGHSMGCQTILRYLESLPTNVRVGGAVLVAGFTQISGLTPEEEVVWKPWARAPLDLARAREHVRSVTALFSDNDPNVPLTNVEVFRRELGANTVTLRNRRHFSGDDGAVDLPEALDAVLTIAGMKP